HSPDAWRARLGPPSSPDAPSRDRPSRGEPRSPNRASPSPRPRRACVRGAGRGRARIRPPEHWRREAGTHVAGSGGAHGARRDSRRFVAGGVERAPRFRQEEYARGTASLKERMKVWLDDRRSPYPDPDSWTWVRTPAEAIELLKTGEVTEISLDHDLG